ncbi:MAG: IS200/IS605 family transposase, partial [Candidatus Brocadiia bacterium]
MAVKSGAHCKFELKYHFVWCPKYRKLALKGNYGRYLCKLIYEVAERYD